MFQVHVAGEGGRGHTGKAALSFLEVWQYIVLWRIILWMVAISRNTIACNMSRNTIFHTNDNNG